MAIQPEPGIIVIFGASGDLARRKLGPALYSLACEGLLPQQTHIVGVARTPMTTEAFRERIYSGVEAYSRLTPAQCMLWDSAADRYTYITGSYEDPATYRKLAQHLAKLEATHGTGGNRLFYLSTPPFLYPVIVEQLGKAKLNLSSPGWTRIIIEKPFGNHLLQLLTLMAMEPPSAFDAQALRDEKVKVLKAIRPPRPDDVVLGQYEGYLAEDGVAADSCTPTFAALRLSIDNWRWRGVPFYLRSGKGMPRKMTEITMEFKHVPHLLFPQNADLTPNHLSLCIQPDEAIHLNFATKVPGAGMRVKPVDMEFGYVNRFGETALPDAYERLLLDAMQGDAALFIRGDEIELAWQHIDRLTGEGWPLIYAVGSWGPAAADALIACEQSAWHSECGTGA